jgi:hypothetical protein
MVDEDARDRAIYQALKAVDEVAAALQTHLIEEHQADPERSFAQSTSTNSLKLLRQARERLGVGLRTIGADTIAQSDEISLLVGTTVCGQALSSAGVCASRGVLRPRLGIVGV